jgi:hypothetical protein
MWMTVARRALFPATSPTKIVLAAEITYWRHTMLLALVGSASCDLDLN